MKKNVRVKLVETYKNFVLINSNTAFLMGDVYLWKGSHIHYVNDVETARAMNLILEIAEKPEQESENDLSEDFKSTLEAVREDADKRVKIVGSLNKIKNITIWTNVPLFKKWRSKRVPTGAIVDYNKTEIRIIKWLYEDKETEE